MSRTMKWTGAFLVWLVAFGLYLSTMAPTTSFWDCGEFIAVSNILGIPHPPGYPLLTLIGRVAVVLLSPVSREVAWRVNFMSPFFSSLTAALLYLCVVKMIAQSLPEPGRKREWKENLAICMGGGVAALLAAFASSCWDNSIEAEAYAPAIFLMVAAFWLVLQWRESLGHTTGKKLLLLCTFLWGASVGIHLAALQIAPAIVLFALLVEYREILDLKFLALGVFLFVLGLSVHAYLLIRAGLSPAINECNPSSWGQFLYVLERKQYEPFNFAVRGRFLGVSVRAHVSAVFPLAVECRAVPLYSAVSAGHSHGHPVWGRPGRYLHSPEARGAVPGRPGQVSLGHRAALVLADVCVEAD